MWLLNVIKQNELFEFNVLKKESIDSFQQYRNRISDLLGDVDDAMNVHEMNEIDFPEEIESAPFHCHR